MQTPLLPTQEKNAWICTSELMTMSGLIAEWLIPQILNDLGIDAGNTNNAYLLSHLSPQEDAQAAASIISVTQVAVVVIPSSFLYMLPVLIKYFLADNQQTALTTGMLFALLLSFPGIVFCLFTGRFFTAIGVKESVCKLVNDYFLIFSFALPLWMLATSLSKVASPLGLKRLMYLESLINCICVTGFSRLFTQVYALPYISPIQTIALSNLFCSVARILFYVINYYRLDKFESWQEMQLKKYKAPITFLLQTGWKLCVQLSSELFALYCLPIFTVLLLKNHNANLAVLNVMSQCFIFSMIINLSIAITSMNIIYHFKEKEKPEAVRPCINTLFFVSFFYNSALLGFTITKTNTVVNLFMQPEDNTNTGLSSNFRLLFLISFFGLVFNAFKDIINMSQRALNIFSLPMKVSLSSIWSIGLPLGIVLAMFTDLGVGGLWLGYNIGNIIAGLFLTVHWNLVSKPNIVQEIFSGNETITQELDQISYCFSKFKSDLFPPNQRQEQAYLPLAYENH